MLLMELLDDEANEFQYSDRTEKHIEAFKENMTEGEQNTFETILYWVIREAMTAGAKTGIKLGKDIFTE